jgi:hypothetical protein
MGVAGIALAPRRRRIGFIDTRRRMMKIVRCAAYAAALTALAGGAPVSAQTAQPAVKLNATGTFAGSGTFTGTVTINRFEQRNNQIVAIGVVQGTLTRSSRAIGTALATEVVFPVKLSTGGIQLASRQSPMTPMTPRLMLASATADSSSLLRVIRVTAAQGCTPLQLNIGATNVDLLGLQVALDPIGLTLTGASGTPLGDLVCAASSLIGNVAGLVNLLNSVLGLVTGLLGGLTGGLGGI